MNNLLVLVVCVLGTVTAGRILQRDFQRDIDTADQRIERMSWQDLVRQKFLLDIVHQVQQPLQQDDLIQLDQGLITDENRYRGGIDEQISHIIDLDRQRRLLDQNQDCNIRNVDHVIQLRGIYRILVRSIDFETLQRNAIYLRRNINPVLFVNGLTLAIRDRQDTKNLIMPAMQEILPELYLDQEMIHRVQRMQLEMEHSTRPSLLDLVGLRQSLRGVNPLANIVKPWRELHKRLGLKGQQLRQVQNRVVLPLPTENQGISLVTEDIGMRTFVQNLVQELALNEVNTDNRMTNVQWMGNNNDLILEMEQRRLQQDNDDENVTGNQRVSSLYGLRRGLNENEQIQTVGQISGRRVPLERNIGQGIERLTNYWSNSGVTDNVDQLPTVDINDKRLLHVGRRRQNLNRIGTQEEQLEARLRGLVRNKHLSEGRRVDQEQTGVRGQIREGNNKWWNTDDNEESLIDNLPTVRRDDQRLLHINKRRLGQATENLIPRRVSRIGEGRRVDGEDTMTVEDIMQLIRRDNRLNQMSDEEIVEMLLHNRQRKEQTEQERFMSVVRGDRINEGRRVEQWYQEQDDDQKWNAIRGGYRNDNVQDTTDRLQIVRRDDDRLVHFNRRRVDQQIDDVIPRRVNPMVEDSIRLEDDIIDMRRRNSQEDEQVDSRIRQQEQGHRYRRSIVDIVDNEQSTRRSEMLVHTLRQLVARLNQERISVRLGNDDIQLIDNSRLILANQNQAQRYALRLNEMRMDSRRNRALINQINTVENTLKQVIGQLIRERNILMAGSKLEQFDVTLRVERVIADVLTGRLGDIGILQILREQIQDSNVMQLDPLGLGIDLNDRVLQYTLRRLLNIVDELRVQQLGVYSREQLEMQGVTINDVRVSKLRTRIEEGDIDVSSLLEQPQQMEMLVRQHRLNNLPFTIDMDINSERTQDVIIRMLLGPRQDAENRDLSLEQRRKDFVLLDAINTQLQSGRNRIQHRSTNIGWTTPDVTPYSEIYRRVMTTLRGQQEQLLIGDLVGENGRFPQRLLLPRGRPEGLPMQILVIVSPVERQEQSVSIDRTDGLMGISLAAIEDKRPLGYPLDRRIDNEQELLRLPNVQLQDVVIVHEN